MSPYSSSKRALTGISLAARQELKKDGITVSVVYPYITLTDFEKNTLTYSSPTGGPRTTGPYPPDSAEFVAGKVVDGILSGDAEIFAHDGWRRTRQQFEIRYPPVIRQQE